MKRKLHFESSDEVDQYFTSLTELVPVPEPPPDLWERMESSRRAAQRWQADQSKCPLSAPPESLQIEIHAPASRQKTYPIKVVERIDATFPARKLPRQAQSLRATPISLRELLTGRENQARRR
ncbi:MAG: hypothetical protein DME69_10605 [Verrucomicrobia bacterium]|nr:MAG: hypothetical protein DME69_10605 [Verrucomicrobiota bacterium]